MTHLQMLVSSHQNRASRFASDKIDWDKRKAKWLEVLSGLNQQIRDALLAAGVPADHIQTLLHTISEETLGEYEVQVLQVKIGTGKVTFTPVASVIIGGYGRVDVSGPRGEVKLIAEAVEPISDMEDKVPSYQREWTWSAYPDKSRNGFPLDEEGLAKVLELVLGSA